MKISEKNKQKISEHILAYLYSISPKAVFTVQIAQELVRDEEFIKKLLMNLKKKEFIIAIKKNQKGTPYLKRMRWRLSDKVYSLYKSKQN